MSHFANSRDGGYGGGGNTSSSRGGGSRGRGHFQTSSGRERGNRNASRDDFTSHGGGRDRGRGSSRGGGVGQPRNEQRQPPRQQQQQQGYRMPPGYGSNSRAHFNDGHGASRRSSGGQGVLPPTPRSAGGGDGSLLGSASPTGGGSGGRLHSQAAPHTAWAGGPSLLGATHAAAHGGSVFGTMPAQAQAPPPQYLPPAPRAQRALGGSAFGQPSLPSSAMSASAPAFKPLSTAAAGFTSAFGRAPSAPLAASAFVASKPAGNASSQGWSPQHQHQQQQQAATRDSNDSQDRGSYNDEEDYDDYSGENSRSGDQHDYQDGDRTDQGATDDGGPTDAESNRRGDGDFNHDNEGDNRSDGFVSGDDNDSYCNDDEFGNDSDGGDGDQQQEAGTDDNGGDGNSNGSYRSDDGDRYSTERSAHATPAFSPAAAAAAPPKLQAFPASSPFGASALPRGGSAFGGSSPGSTFPSALAPPQGAAPMSFPAPANAPSAFGAFAAPPAPSAFVAKRGRDEGMGTGTGAGTDDTTAWKRAAPVSASAAFGRPAPQQQQQQQHHAPIDRPAMRQKHRIDTTRLSAAAQLFRSFLVKISAEGTRETAWPDMDTAFFGEAIFAPGPGAMTADFSFTLDELSAVWEQMRRRVGAFQGAEMRGEMWVALFAVGCQANLVMHAITGPPDHVYAPGLATFVAGVRHHEADALTDACALAKQLNDLNVELYQHEAAMLVPYSVLPTLFARVRTVFDEAGARGAYRVSSNMNMATSKIFAVLLRRLKASAVEELPDLGGGGGASPGPKWMLLPKNARDQALVMAFAALVYEIRVSESPFTDDVAHFVAAFHRGFPNSLEERCMLYYSEANQLLQRPLTVASLDLAGQRLAQALTTLPRDAAATAGAATRAVAMAVGSNEQILTIKLVAVNLARGRVPRAEEAERLATPELADAIAAVRAADLPLFDRALLANGVFFIETNTNNIMMAARERLALLLVVKYYLSHACEKLIPVADLVAYHGLRYTPDEAMAVWLLPLLIKSQINGVLNNQKLLVSNTEPFEGFSMDALRRAAAEDYGATAVAGGAQHT